MSRRRSNRSMLPGLPSVLRTSCPTSVRAGVENRDAHLVYWLSDAAHPPSTPIVPSLTRVTNAGRGTCHDQKDMFPTPWWSGPNACSNKPRRIHCSTRHRQRVELSASTRNYGGSANAAVSNPASVSGTLCPSPLPAAMLHFLDAVRHELQDDRTRRKADPPRKDLVWPRRQLRQAPMLRKRRITESLRSNEPRALAVNLRLDLSLMYGRAPDEMGQT